MRRRGLLGSFRYAWDGVVYCVRTQPNMRIHFLAAALALGLGLWLELQAAEMAVLLLTIGMVFIAEMLNTAVEKLVDLVSPQYHPLAKIAKDVAAGAVLVAAMIAATVGYLLLVSRFV